MCLDVREMRKISLGIMTFALAQLAIPAVSAEEMFENLKFGDSKKVVQDKLEQTNRFNMPPKTMMGRTGLNGMYKAKQKLNGLEFSLYFGWDENNGQTISKDEGKRESRSKFSRKDKNKSKNVNVGGLTLNQVDLYSSSAARAKLQDTYTELATLLTGLYGKPKFNNGLPAASTVHSEGMTMAGACWLYGSDAVMLSIGKLTKGHNIVVSFMDKQPKLIKTP